MGEAGQRIALAGAAAATAVALYGVPSWAEPITDVCVLASLISGATIVLLALTRLCGAAGVAVERTWIALFLAGMPVVYVVKWIATRHDTGPLDGWLAVELVGLLLYGGLAFAGLRLSPWLLPLGVTAHGIAWDAWHLLGAAVVPPWYARGCLIVDVGLGIYLATRIAAWRAVPPVSSRS
jgi:hypothetical protein